MTAESTMKAIKIANNPQFWAQVFGDAYLSQKEKESKEDVPTNS